MYADNKKTSDPFRNVNLLKCSTTNVYKNFCTPAEEIRTTTNAISSTVNRIKEAKYKLKIKMRCDSEYLNVNKTIA